MTKVWSRGVSGLGLLLLFACGDDSSPDGESAAEAFDIVVISLDTMRPDRLGCYGNATVKTPHLDAFAEEAVLFEKAFTPVPSTLPSHCSLFTGKYPAQHGVHDNGIYALPETQETLAERFASEGYETAAFVSAFVLDHQFGLAQGFDIYDDEMEDPLSKVSVGDLPDDLDDGDARWQALMATAYQRRAEAVTTSALGWLEESDDDKPLFLWVHYFDPHAPYDAPGDDARMYDPDYDGAMDGHAATFFEEVQRRSQEGGFSRAAMERDRRHMVARYEAEVTYMDRWLGRLFDALRARPQWERTVVVVVGDHGESFGEHSQIWEHNGEVYDEVVHVPLLVHRPADVTAARSKALVRTIDIAPTLLELTGLSPDIEMVGQSLVPLLEAPTDDPGRDVYLQALRETQLHGATESSLALRTANTKAIVPFNAANQPGGAQVFDLARDPEEKRPGPDPQQGWRTRVLRRQEMLRSNEPLPLRPLGDLQSQALEALGYLKRGEPEPPPPEDDVRQGDGTDGSSAGDGGD